MVPKPNVNPECVKVVVRCRPLSSQEVEDQRKRAVEMVVPKGEVSIRNPQSDEGEPPKMFTFDAVYDWNSLQESVFNDTALPIVNSVIEGYNGTIFAYGQTGTGKTHTMEGKWDPPEQRGITPRSFVHIFQKIAEDTDCETFLVRASYLEIYNEEVRDLLSKDPKNKLPLKEDVERGVYVKDLTSYVVKGVEEMEHVLQAGKKNRSVGATLMNQDSSRSHSIFSIVIESSANRNDGSRAIRAGKLNLVDLAGSERQSKTGASGERLVEATKINLSLSALGNVISALVDGKSTHIPYRDSKLTRLLQDSLGGNTKTVMVANLGPADYNYDETISTLRYANRAKNIKNKPRINEDPKDTMIREFQAEIIRLREQLEGKGDQGGEGGIHGVSNEQLQQIQDQVNAEKAAIEQAKDIAESEKQRVEEELRKRQEELEKERSERDSMAKHLKAMEEKLVAGGENLLEKTEEQRRELEKQQEILQQQQEERARLAVELQEREEAHLIAEEKFVSIQDELEAKNKKLKKLWQKYQGYKSELRDIQHEFQQEKEELLEDIREMNRQVKRHALIISAFIPESELRKIESRCFYDEELDEWKIEHIKFAGNNLKRPVSIAGAKRPMSAAARNAAQSGSDETRLKGENILNLELDMPDRTTRDYDERIFTEGDVGFAVPNIPNVYFSYPDEAGAPTTDDSRKSRASKKSSRPASARRKGDRPQSSRTQKDVARMEVPGLDEETQDFPQARGLKSRR